MKQLIALIFVGFSGVVVAAQGALATDGTVPNDSVAVDLPPLEQWKADPTTVFSAADITLSDFKWQARPVVVFADSDANPAFQEQLTLLAEGSDALVERDVIVIVDTDPDARSDLRRKLRPRGFMLTLIGKDGGVNLRKPFPWDARELSRSIDKMPLRQQEIRDRRDDE